MERDDNMVSKIARFSLDRRVTMFMIFLTILAVGLISANRLPLEMNPRGLEGHYMSIHARWNVGVPPETMDKIGLPLEEELSTVRGLDHITTHDHRVVALARVNNSGEIRILLLVSHLSSPPR